VNEYRFSDLAVGMREEFTRTVTPEMLRAFAALSGDTNLLHSSSDEARGRGFRDVVVFGMLTSSFYSALVGVYLPGRWCLLHGIKIDFVAPAFPGDELTVRGEIAHLSEAYRRAEVNATIHDARGTLVSRAKITVGIGA
jgi:3-hydroxybutyryl-CoA dehydratase